MKKVLVTEELDRIPLRVFDGLVEVEYHPNLWDNPEVLRDRVRGFDGLLVRNVTKVDRALVEASDRLQVVGRVGVGLDNIDVDACQERGVRVVNAPGLNASAVAEMTMLLLLALARRAALRNGAEGMWDRLGSMGSELRGRTIGLVGFGAIGRAVASRAQAFEMIVLASDPLLSERVMEGVPIVPLRELLSSSDVVSVHIPLSSTTVRLVDREFLDLMKPGSWLINCSRGGVVDESALLDALKSGVLAGAALDVREIEPPPELDPLGQRDDVILTPHVGGLTFESDRRVLDHVCGAVAEHLLNESL